MDFHPSELGGRPIRVVVAGAGIAGLEALLALRALGGARVQLTLVAPDDEFIYRPPGHRGAVRGRASPTDRAG